MTKRPNLNVSRETMERLECLHHLVRKWSPKINLISKNTIDDIWNRHIADSCQLFDLVTGPISHWVDIGSGGGFPGLVIAIMAEEMKNPPKLTLIESDTRKSVFLNTALREVGVEATVLNHRIEDVAPLAADVVSARALAKLSKLLEYSHYHLSPTGVGVFPKGAQWENELREAQSQWNFKHEVVRSKTESGPSILVISEVSSCQT